MGRRKPYTQIGIRRKRCYRCGAQATQQWQICADGNIYRAICDGCDIALNELVLRWMRDRKWRGKMKAYRLRFEPTK